MFIIIAMLSIALVPTGNDGWLPDESMDPDGVDVATPAYLGMPTKCFFNISVSNGIQLSSMIVSVFFLVTSYITRFIKLFQGPSDKARLYLRTKPGNGVKGLLGKMHRGMQVPQRHRWVISIPYWSTLTMFILARAWYDLMESMFWEVGTKVPKLLYYKW